MPDVEPGRHESGTSRGPLRALGEFVGDIVGEFVLAIAACALFGGVIAGLLWGWDRAPRSTVALSVAVLALVAFGAYRLVRDDEHQPRSTIAALAVGFAVFVGVWLFYVLSYCACGTD